MAKKAKAKRKTSASRGAAGAKVVPMHKVVHFVRMLHDRKRAAKFIASARAAGASVTVHPKAQKFLKGFMSDQNLQGSKTARGIDPCPGSDPWNCS